MFTRLDFPTPLLPISTAVVPSGMSRRTCCTLSGSAADTTKRLHVGAGQPLDPLAHLTYLLVAFGEVGLGQHHGHIGAGLVGQHQLAFQPAHVHVGQGLGHDHPVEVRRQHLGDGPLGGVLAHEGAGARADGLDDALVVAKRHEHFPA